jgi:taurine dioxygenase
MRVEPLSDMLGVELVDFDLVHPRDPEEQAELRRLFCEHHLLLIRGQDVDDADQTRFVGCFGPVHRVATGAEASYISNRPDRMLGTGTTRLLWHSDGTYGARPGIATSLWAEDVSPDSSPTAWVNAVRVLEELPAALRARIETLNAVHLRDTEAEPTVRWRVEDISADASPERFARHTHPIVYPMPHTDQRTLLVNELLTSHIADLPRDEGEALLQELFGLLYADANIFTHRWEKDDVIIWDNLALQHNRPVDMGSGVRHLRRQSLDGWFTDDGVLDWTETARLYAGPRD